MTPRTDQSILEAKQKGFSQKITQTQTFKLTVFEKITNPHAPWVVYLEGDGHSMQSRYMLSHNPTPHQPLALELATKDKRDNVIYIARPCQYTPLESDTFCDRRYWSTHRFAQEVVEATNQVIQNYKKILKTPKVNLIGFSGGGGLAVLVAAHRSDVSSITTIAGDLDINRMTQIHRTTPQVGSLNPLKFADTLQVKQLHLSGAKDKVVPPEIGAQFVAQTHQDCATHQIIPRFSHHDGWKESWPDLLDLMPCPNETD